MRGDEGDTVQWLDQTFNIRISGQRLGIHEFDFSVDDSFFSAFERSQIQVGNVSVHAEMDRKDREFDIRLSLEGWVEQACVRCLEFDFWDVPWSFIVFISVF